MHRIFFVRSSKEWTIQNSFGLLFYTAIPRIPSNRLELLENSLCAWQLWHALSIYRKFLCFSCGATKQLLLLIFLCFLFTCRVPHLHMSWHPIPVLLSCKPKRSYSCASILQTKEIRSWYMVWLPQSSSSRKGECHAAINPNTICRSLPGTR